MQIIWSRQADDDLLQIWDYLADQASIAIADEQVRRIVVASEQLSEWPQSGPLRDAIIPGMRSIVASPYVIFYRLHNDAVQVVRVLHGRRDIEAVFAEES